MFFRKLRDSLANTTKALTGRIKALVKGRKIDAALWTVRLVEVSPLTAERNCEIVRCLRERRPHFPTELATMIVRRCWADVMGARLRSVYDSPPLPPPPPPVVDSDDDDVIFVGADAAPSVAVLVDTPASPTPSSDLELDVSSVDNLRDVEP